MKNTFQKFLSLNNATQISVVEAFFLQIIIKTLLSILPFNTLKKICFWVVSKKDSVSDSKINQVVYAVKTTAPYLKTTCLVQALTLKFFAKNTKLVVGVAVDNATFEAHAWIENQGKIILGESKEVKFTPIWIW